MCKLANTLVLLVLTHSLGCAQFGFGVKRESELNCPTDIRKTVPWCAGEDAIFYCPCRPRAMFYGHQPTCWRNWPTSGAAWRDSYCCSTATADEVPAAEPQILEPMRLPAAEGPAVEAPSADEPAIEQQTTPEILPSTDDESTLNDRKRSGTTLAVLQKKPNTTVDPASAGASASKSSADTAGDAERTTLSEAADAAAQALPTPGAPGGLQFTR